MKFTKLPKSSWQYGNTIAVIGMALSFGGLLITSLFQNYADMGRIVIAAGIAILGLKDILSQTKDTDKVYGEILYYLKHLDIMIKGKERDDEIRIVEKLDTIIGENNYLLPKDFDKKWFQLRTKIYAPEGKTLRDEMLELLKK